MRKWEVTPILLLIGEAIVRERRRRAAEAAALSYAHQGGDPA